MGSRKLGLWSRLAIAVDNNRDNKTGWLDWSHLETNRDVFRFFKNMISFRKRHPSLGRSRFWREDVTWYGTGEKSDLSHDSHTLAFCLHGASQDDDDIYVMINAYWERLDFQAGSVVAPRSKNPDQIVPPRCHEDAPASNRHAFADEGGGAARSSACLLRTSQYAKTPDLGPARAAVTHSRDGGKARPSSW